MKNIFAIHTRKCENQLSFGSDSIKPDGLMSAERNEVV